MTYRKYARTQEQADAKIEELRDKSLKEIAESRHQLNTDDQLDFIHGLIYDLILVAEVVAVERDYELHKKIAELPCVHTSCD